MLHEFYHEEINKFNKSTNKLNCINSVAGGASGKRISNKRLNRNYMGMLFFGVEVENSIATSRSTYLP